MKTIKKELPTGITTVQNDSGGLIKVKASNYDDRFDLPSSATILAQQFKQQLKNLH